MNLEEKYKSEVMIIKTKILEKKINDILNNYKNTEQKNIFNEKNKKYNLISNYKYYKTEHNEYLLTIKKIFFITCYLLSYDNSLYNKIIEIKNQENYIKNKKKVFKYYDIIGIHNIELLCDSLSQII